MCQETLSELFKAKNRQSSSLSNHNHIDYYRQDKPFSKPSSSKKPQRIIRNLRVPKRNNTANNKYSKLMRCRERRDKSLLFLPFLNDTFIKVSTIITLILLQQHNAAVVVVVEAQQVFPSSPESPSSSGPDSTGSASDSSSSQQFASNAATCFGGLQTFEKISMSSFENPLSSSSSSSSASSSSSSNGNSNFGSGILVQQDDQALTSECVNLCRSQSNCLSFVIDYNKFECKSYATTQQELQQEFDSKYHQSAARSLNNNSTNNSTEYQASNVHFQHLLPSASSNYFEKICLDGVANRNQFGDVCGQNRLWTIERVVDSFLDGYVEKEVTNVNNKDECSKLCIFEAQFVCRSADYDQQSRLCRLSKEDRRTQPQAMRHVSGSNRQYLENQCATPGPSSCVYETKKNFGIISMDALKFAQTLQDCQMKCNQELTFNCRSYSFHQQRCFLSGDDSSSLNSNLIKLPQKQGWLFGEKKCLVELCTKGIFSYEKITGYTLRSALSTPIDLMMSAGSSPAGASTTLSMMMIGNGGGGNLDDLDRLQHETNQDKLRQLLPSLNYPHHRPTLTNTSDVVSTMMMIAANSDPLIESSSSQSFNSRQQRNANNNNNLAITNHCRHSCDLGYLNCPAFTIDYKNNRCQRLDRNSQGRHHELVARDGFAYYEKICLRVPEIMSMCQDKYWIFERVIGYELAPRFYDKSLKFVQSRRDCEEYCLEEKQFQCRSALYNDETSDCKLSRYDRRLATQEGGYYRNFNVRISYLENQCVRDHQTLQAAAEKENQVGSNTSNKLQCFYDQAKDEPSYPTYTEYIEMVQPPSIEMESSSIRDHHHHHHHHQTNKNSSRYGLNYCEQLCNENSKFECRSFGYYSSTAQCFLSGDDSTSAGEMATTLSTGFTYFEKKCRFPAESEGGTSSTASNSTNASEPSEPSLNPYFQPPHRHDAGTSSDSNIKPNSNKPASNNDLQPDLGNNNNYQPNQFKPINSNSPPKPAPSQQAGDANANATTQQLADPNQYKCGLGHTFSYQRISGFEPIGGYLTLLLKNNDQPGIVAECGDLCKRAYECRAFVVDYNSNQCYAMLENSAVGMLSLRQTLGKDYFEGFCLADYLLSSSANSNNCGNKTWLMDKIVDQAVIGVQHQKLLADSDRIQCRQACLEERLFWCKSAMFDAATGDCKLYSIDRESMPQMRLLFTKGVDFFENQCQITTNSCPYDAIERDMTIVSVTKSLQARSTFDCEHACNLEQTFNCRSYTYLDQYPSLPNMCLLSSDSRSTSQKGSVKERQRTLYAERNCFYRRPRHPGSMSSSSSSSSGGSSLSSSQAGYSNNNSAMMKPYSQQQSTTTNHQEQDPYKSTSHHQGHSTLDSYAPPTLPNRIQPPEPIPMPPDSLGGGGALPLGQNPCEPHQYTFERTFGYDYRLGLKERAPIAPTIGIAIGCQQECLRRADRCQSFVVEYGLPYQSCFLIDSQVGANKELLVKSPNSAYFEKVCLPRLGVNGVVGIESLPSSLAEAPSMTHSQLVATHGGGGGEPAGIPPPPVDLQSMDIAPSYSSEPWSPQVSPSSSAIINSHNYLQQQQQLIQNYPSRSCAKLWSFERFINHNFTTQADRLIENVLFRSQCETFCLNEASFNCRAATFDYSSKLCRLFRYTRRTIMSQFVNLELPLTTNTTQPSSSIINSSPGTATQVINGEVESLHTSSSFVNQINTLRAKSRQLQATEGVAPKSELMNKNIDYMENTCAPEPSSCQYRQLYDLFNPYIDKINHAVSLGDCQRQCDLERLFGCKSINYDPSSRNCMLINEDIISLNRAGQQSSSPLLPKKNNIYSEKGNCELISVQCTSQEMLVSINFDTPFRGRVMAKGNPEQCYLIGDGQTQLQFPIVFGPKCNSRQEGHNTFVNEIVIQQHPIIMTDNDKTIRIMCAFEAPEQTITLKNPTSRDGNKTGIDVNPTPVESSRTRYDKHQQFNSIVSNKAAPPSVLLRILDLNGRDASMINLGDDLMLKIQMQTMESGAGGGGSNSGGALGIFARNLAARSSNGESLLLIDNDGCPVDNQVFPALDVDPKDGKSLYSTFKAFRFPSSGLVNFEVQIRFCPERCQPVECHKSKMRSYGRRKREVGGGGGDGDSSNSHQFQLIRTPVLQSINRNDQDHQAIGHQLQLSNPLDAMSTVMKPGKAFQYVRELMLTNSQQQQQPDPTVNREKNPAEDGTQAQQTTTTESSIVMEPNNKIGVANEEQSSDQPASSPSPTTEINQDFEQQNQKTSSSSDLPEVLAGNTMPPTTGNPQQTNDLNHQLVSKDDLFQQTRLQQQQQQQHQTKPILMHIDGKIVPSIDDLNFSQNNNQLPTGGFFPNQQNHHHHHHYHSSSAAPYGRFPPLNNDNDSKPQQQQVVVPLTVTTTVDKIINDSGFKKTIQETDIETTTTSTMSSSSFEELPASQLDQQQQLNSMSTTTRFDASPKSSLDETQRSNKEIPLRFSILVGENQNQNQNQNQNNPMNNNQWIPGVGPPASVLVVNSTKVADLDHIVIPGKGVAESQFEDSSPLQISNNNNLNNVNTIMSETTKSSENEMNPIQNTKRPTTNSLYEQTFDAQPSNSVEAEVKLQHGNHHHHQQLDQVGGITRNNRHTTSANNNNNNNNNQLNSNEQHSSESAASHRHVDCSNHSELSSSTAGGGGGRLWTFVWTGAIVIALNVCLVVLSLILYFKRVQFRNMNHDMIRSTTSTDCETIGSGSNSGRWPSVLLKSKNSLGTSLNTHEHFFCKLNSSSNLTSAINNTSNNNGRSSSSSSQHNREFNWPNLSSSSTHSTISSMAARTSPKPSLALATSIVRISGGGKNNQQANRSSVFNSNKPSFHDHHTASSASSSIRTGNFNTGSHRRLPDLNSPYHHHQQQQHHHHHQEHATYTNNIDDSNPDTFDSMR